MHVAATNPQALDPSGLDPAIVTREKDVLADKYRQQGKPENVIEKKLNDLGIFHYWQLAELDHDTAHKIGEEVGLPSRADAWVAQAKTLTAEAE